MKTRGCIHRCIIISFQNMASKQSSKKTCSSSVEVLSILRDFRRTKKFCDITLKCGERNFYAHCCVLASVSPYFLAMFRSGMSEVHTQVKSVDLAFLSVSPSSASVILDYIYGERIEIDMENAFELLAIADYMLLNQLKNELCEYLSDALTLPLERADFCFATRRYAELYGCKKLYENATCFIKAMFYRLTQTSAFCELSLQELESFLECDDLSANEDEVIESILKWVSYSQEHRENFVDQLLNDHVRPSTTLGVEYCADILARYGFTKFHILDILKEKFLDFNSGCHEGRQGQEVIFVFDNKKMQAYTPGLIPWHPIAPMPESKQHFKVVTLNGFVYVLGGTDDEKISVTVWRYNPHKNCWKKVAPMLKSAVGFALAALDGCVFVTGGPNPKYTMQKYDPDSDTWSFGTSMQVVRINHCMVAFQNRYLVVIGGNTHTTDAIYSVEKYDIHTDTWSYMPQLNIGRIESSAVVLEDRIYVIGGHRNSIPFVLDNCEVYSSSTNEWSLIESTVTPRRGVGITIYQGRVLILGGSLKKHSNFEYYCEETKSWKSKDSDGYNSEPCQCCTVTLSGRQICELYES